MLHLINQKLVKNSLKVIILLVGIVIVIQPFLPELDYQLNKKNISKKLYYESSLSNETETRENLLPPPESNVLLIPSIGVNGEIHEGADENTLNLGIWRKPNSAKPGTTGNTVIVAHRYLNSFVDHSFYHLPKVEVNEKFIVFWEGQELVYQVTEKFETSATSVWIEDQSDEEILTLYTCTPLWSQDKRLVIKAKRVTSAQL